MSVWPFVLGFVAAVVAFFAWLAWEMRHDCRER